MTSPFDHGCTYVDPETGAPCLKVRGHDDIKGDWKCPHCGPTPGKDERFVCACGRGAQAPSQHLTIVGVDGAVTKIVSLEKFKAEMGEAIVGRGPLLPYSLSMLDGVITRGVQHAEGCASRKAPPGHLLVGVYKCDCDCEESA